MCLCGRERPVIHRLQGSGCTAEGGLVHKALARLPFFLFLLCYTKIILDSTKIFVRTCSYPIYHIHHPHWLNKYSDPPGSLPHTSSNITHTMYGIPNNILPPLNSTTIITYPPRPRSTTRLLYYHHHYTLLPLPPPRLSFHLELYHLEL